MQMLYDCKMLVLLKVLKGKYSAGWQV